MLDRLAFLSPEDAGGADVDDAANAKPDAELPDGLQAFLKSQGIELPDVLDPFSVKTATLLWKLRGKELRDAENQRKRARAAEGKLEEMDLQAIMPNLKEEDRQRVSGWIESTKKASLIEESLAMVAEAGIPMTPEILQLLKAGPEATRAYIAAVKVSPQGEQLAVMLEGTAFQERLREQIGKFLGVAADQDQRRSDQGGATDPLARFRKEKTYDDEILEAMKKSANERLKKE
jgi:hypothetical protein